MSRASFRFYGELNDFLPPEKRGKNFSHSFQTNPSVKDVIEALGVPHTEVDLILVHGASVDFRYAVRDGDRVSVYPVFESIDISPLVRLRPRPLRQLRFLLDTHLGRLAGYLRLVGFDTLYRNDYQDEELARISVAERRILLTKDRGLLKRSAVTHGYYVRATHPRQQLLEVLRRFELWGCLVPFARCLRCNGLLAPAPKEEVLSSLPPQTRQLYEEFQRCCDCGRVFWKGSHYQRMQRFLAQLASAAPPLGRSDRG